MKADPGTEAAVMDVLTQCFESFICKDLDGLLVCFAPDTDVVLMGAGTDDKYIGWDAIKDVFERAFEQFDHATYKIGWHRVSSEGSVAWVAADIVFDLYHKGHNEGEQMRLTGVLVLEKKADRWFIVQSHDVLPTPGHAGNNRWSGRR